MTGAAVMTPAREPSAGHDPTAAIAALRAELDALDDAILDAVRARVHVSQAIQRCRMAHGGCRTDLSRETFIVAKYSAAVPAVGARLAVALLGLCKGSD